MVERLGRSGMGGVTRELEIPRTGGGLLFRVQPAGQELVFEPRHALVVGYAGREQEAVRRHVHELAAQGVPAPARTPELYLVSPGLLTQAERVQVAGPGTSGEAECTLVLHAGQVYVGIGSDHTDRELERQDILASKRACPKPVGSELWHLEAVLDHWDELELRSWVGEAAPVRPYQRGSVASLLRPEDVLAFVRGELGGLPEDAVVYCGTLPLLEGTFSREPAFAAELWDPRLGRALRCAYRVVTVLPSAAAV